eukprot:NODE_2919_length_855_cov_255.543750.p2 GENE.NODE_2919_length_855_cov_255.543750~~NODE_2919_length_855_cov_255.543750.p2  ORF type:complete len:122 (-),score=39.35 NODE_2919_length_855_cov_255.543750:436-801(-)
MYSAYMGEKYCDDVYEYRRVTVPREMWEWLPKGRCMNESEWRFYGITMSRGWEHYDHHLPEGHVLLFRRILGTDPKTGSPSVEMMQKALERQRYVAELEEMRQRLIWEQARKREQEPVDLF